MYVKSYKMAGDSFILLPDEMYNKTNLYTDNAKHREVIENSDSDSSEDIEVSADEYLKEMEKILRKIRKSGDTRRLRFNKNILGEILSELDLTCSNIIQIV